MKFHAIPFLLCVSATLRLSATNYYVDYSTGSDSNAGTSTGAPWKHSPYSPFFTGTRVSLADGDFVNYKGGGTNYDSIITNTVLGGSAKWDSITFQTSASWGTGQAIFDGGGTNTQFINLGKTSKGLTFSGFEIRNFATNHPSSTEYCLHIGDNFGDSVSWIIFTNIYMHDLIGYSCMRAAILIGSNILVRDSRFQDLPSRVLVFNGTNINFVGNYFSNCLDHAVDGGAADGYILVRSNRFFHANYADESAPCGVIHDDHFIGTSLNYPARLMVCENDFEDSSNDLLLQYQNNPAGSTWIWNNRFQSSVTNLLNGGGADNYTNVDSFAWFNNTYAYKASGVGTPSYRNCSNPSGNAVTNLWNMNNAFYFSSSAWSVTNSTCGGNSVPVCDLHRFSGYNAYTNGTPNYIQGVGANKTDLAGFRTIYSPYLGSNEVGSVECQMSFVDLPNRDLHPLLGSSLVGAGTNLTSWISTYLQPHLAVIPAELRPDPTKDAAGNQRPASGAWDIGAYQGTNAPAPAPTGYRARVKI